MKIFRVSVERSQKLDTLVLAEKQDAAEYIVQKALRYGELSFEDDYAPNEITRCGPIEISHNTLGSILDEIKHFGILNENSELMYDEESIKKMFKDHEKEEYLKKNHMEFDFTEKRQKATLL